MDLMKLLPGYYAGNITMETLQRLLSEETVELERALSDAIKNCFVTTATGMGLLSRYEELYGLDVQTKESDEYRRERIIAKIMGSSTTTKELIRRISAVYSNGEAEVIEDNVHYKFTIRFTGIIGIPKGLESLRATIEEIKPAHLVVTFEYIYNTHAALHRFTHEQLHSYTHEQLRNTALA